MVGSTGGRRIGCSGERWLARCGDSIVVLFGPASVGTKREKLLAFLSLRALASYASGRSV
eukprot:44537-Chlamydomonas_euryale.AAC.1